MFEKFKKEIDFVSDFFRLHLQPLEDMPETDVWNMRCVVRFSGDYLTDQERKALMFRLGLIGFRPHSVLEVAQRFKLKPEDVNAMVEKALTGGWTGSSGEPPFSGAGIPRRPKPEGGAGEVELSEPHPKED